MIHVHNLLCRRVTHFLGRLDPSFVQENNVFFFRYDPDDQSVLSQLQCALAVEDGCIRFAMDYPIKPHFEDEGNYWYFTDFFGFIPPYVEYGGFVFCEETHRIQYQITCDCSQCPPSRTALLDCIRLGEESLNKWNPLIQALLAEVPPDVLEENLSQEQSRLPDGFGKGLDALDYEDALPLRPVSRFLFRLVARKDALFAEHRHLSSAVHCAERLFALCGFLAAVLISGGMTAEQLLELACTNWDLPLTVPDLLIRLSCLHQMPLGRWLLVWGILGVFGTVRFLAGAWKQLCEQDEEDTGVGYFFIQAMTHIVKLCFFLFCGTAALHFAAMPSYDLLPAILIPISQFGALFLLCMLALSTCFRESSGTPWRWTFLGLLHFAAAIGWAFLPVFL